MKKIRVAIFVLALFPLTLASAPDESNWLSDFKKAQAEAKAGHKLLLVNFTGSDWCIWCKKLQAEVFAQPEFQQYAKENLVLVTVDFPRRKPLPEEVQKQNEQLAQRYDVGGFPTIVVLNDRGQQIAELGYMEGGASAFVNELKKLPKG